MPEKPLFIVLASEQHEKIQLAAMMASVAAVSETPVHVLVSMGALYAFQKGLDREDRYQGGRFSQALKDKKAPDALTLFEQGKRLGVMTLHACSMALDILEWEEDDLVEGLFDGSLGMTKFLADAKEGEVITI